MHKLCSIDDLANPGSKGFEVDTGYGSLELFLVRKGDEVYAYKNACPHRGVPLEWNDDEFLDDSKEQIICSTHGALFSIENGRCSFGPCVNESLTPIAIMQKDRAIYLK
jgi:nitrite reductase/ring-hydroxylating ferredoxin subunit